MLFFYLSCIHAYDRCSRIHKKNLVFICKVFVWFRLAKTGDFNNVCIKFVHTIRCHPLSVT